MRQINLLPGEIAEKRRARQIMILLGAGVLALVAVLALIYLAQTARLAGERSKLNDAKRSNAALQRQVDALRQFATLQDTLRTKEDLLVRLTQNEVRWSTVLSNVSLVIPSDVWLTSFTGTISAPAPGTPRPSTGFVIGTVQTSGMTFTHLDVAKWLTRLVIDEFAFPYLSLSAKSAAEVGQELVSFNSTFQLSEKSLRRNQPGGERKP